MKINFVKTSIAVALSFLVAYGFYNLYDNENRMFLSIGSFLFLTVTLVLAIGVESALGRTLANIKIVAIAFFVISFFSNLMFSIINFSVPSYLIINGVLLLVFILTTYTLYKTKQ